MSFLWWWRHYHPLQSSPASPPLLSCSTAGLSRDVIIRMAKAFWLPSSRHLPKLEMIVDGSVHWISWSTGVLNNVWNWHTPVRPYKSINCSNRGIGRHNNMPARSFLINNAFSAASKLRTPNMHCWSHKTLVAILWTHFRVNRICIKSFCPQKNE